MHFFPRRAAVRHLLFCTLLLCSLVGGCNSPSAPTPPPPPPPPDAPTITCSESIARGTINAGGLSVSYPAPETKGGQSPVNVSCTPESGATFPIGQSTVTCTATDGLQRQASCTFGITITKLPQVSRVRYMAFGDSITAGEVTFPVSSASASSKQVIVPAASYPTVLQRLLRARYQFQGDQITVNNAGVGGEKAIDARNRFFATLSTTRPEVVLILSGHNDIPRGEDGAASGAANEVRIMAQGAKTSGARVFIATPVPGRPGGNRTIDPFLLVDYANRMRAVASQEGAVLVDLYAAMLPDVFRYIGVDGLHPNEAGYTRIAELFYEAIVRELEVR